MKNFAIIGSAAFAVALATAPVGASTFDIIVSYTAAGVPKDGDENPATPDTLTINFTERQKQLFGAAETFWESVLTGFQGVAAPVYHIEAYMTDADGPYDILAFAAANTIVTEGSFQRAIDGYMQFDSADFGPGGQFAADEDLFLDSAIHEIGHALGFSTDVLGEFGNNLLENAGGATSYKGALGLAAFNAANNTNVTSIAMEPGGGHWAECWIDIALGNACATDKNDPELMTPLAFDGIATLNAATIGVFRDIGYTTVDPREILLPAASSIPSVSAVPLPASAWLILGGLGSLGFMRRRRGVA